MRRILAIVVIIIFGPAIMKCLAEEAQLNEKSQSARSNGMPEEGLNPSEGN